MLLSDNSLSRSHTTSLLAKMRSSLPLLSYFWNVSRQYTRATVLAYIYAEITFLLHIRHFLLDFENNGTVEISEFFCVGLAIENKLDQKNLGVWWSPLRFRYSWGVAHPKRHIYDISANNPCFLRANLMFYVGCSGRPTKHPPQKSRKSPFSILPLFRSSILLRVKNPEFLTMGIN